MLVVAYPERSVLAVFESAGFHISVKVSNLVTRDQNEFRAENGRALTFRLAVNGSGTSCKSQRPTTRGGRFRAGGYLSGSGTLKSVVNTDVFEVYPTSMSQVNYSGSEFSFGKCREAAAPKENNWAFERVIHSLPG